MECHPRRQRAARRQWGARRRRSARRRRPPWPCSLPSVPSAPRGPPCCKHPGLAAAPAAWRAAAWGRARDRPATVRGRPPRGRRPCDVANAPGSRPTHAAQVWGGNTRHKPSLPSRA
eukprot:scaffold86895_cov39-Phaeocystis_antarctica.AAC.1